MDDLLLHPVTRRELAAMLHSPAHAVVLVGPVGSGKGTIARALAAGYLQKTVIEAAKDAYYKEVTSAGTSISIEAVRELQKFTTLKTTGQRAIRRVIVLEDSHAMTTEAQNAFLKLLEEPPADTAIIMTVDHPQHLLPTVMSRLQPLLVLPPEKQDVLAYFTTAGHAAANAERAYLLSGGAVGLLRALLEEDTAHPLAAQVQQAKQLYGQSIFERLAAVEGLSKQKESLPGLMTAFRRITLAALEHAAAKQQIDAAQKWHRRLQAIHRSERDLQRSANPKLLLTNLFLQL